jgi:virginiamycin B lyase
MRLTTLSLSVLLSLPALAAETGPLHDKQPHKPGVKDAQVSLESLEPSHTFEVGGVPDWMVVTNDAVWLANRPQKKVRRIDPAANKVVAEIEFPKQVCSGLASGFGSIWVPLCDAVPGLGRIDITTNTIAATLPFGPIDTEGGITVSTDAVWIVIDTMGTLARIDPKTNTVAATIKLPPSARNPLFADGTLWVSDVENNALIMIDPATNAIIGTLPVGPRPRFMTAANGSLWTLNQADGSLTRIDTKTRMVTATIKAGIPGTGGEIAYGAGAVWTTVFDIPLTRIDGTTNVVTRQWVGSGGDSVRFGFGSVWLTHARAGLLWRFPESTAR